MSGKRHFMHEYNSSLSLSNLTRNRKRWQQHTQASWLFQLGNRPITVRLIKRHLIVDLQEGPTLPWISPLVKRRSEFAFPSTTGSNVRVERCWRKAPLEAPNSWKAPLFSQLGTGGGNIRYAVGMLKI
ncbi:hypothetical protein HNY73_016616 [Argiope bruennichi]|uniref:Uncharacterized protein n=1 Tax=Argiope bruennichi TaxID=94029 RepID=A0A8T0EJ17_ARGBR|nr:hypothetical protein HNY73_016616 [Argiope bruennichi]